MLTHNLIMEEQWKLPWMATAIDKNFSDARWQAQGPKFLEPTIVSIFGILLSWKVMLVIDK